MQFGESDLNFVRRLMEKFGLYYFFIHTEAGHCLVVTDSKEAHRPVPEYATVPYVPTQSGGQVRDTECIDTLSVRSRVKNHQFFSADYNFLTPAKVVSGKAQGAPGFSAPPPKEHFAYPGGFQESTNGELLTRVGYEVAVCQKTIYTGGGNARGISAGYTVTPTHHDVPAFAHKLLVIASSHRISESAAEAGGSGSGYHGSFTAIPAATQFRTERGTACPRVRGVQTAKVVGPQGEEIHTDEYGRVRVHFFWDRHVEKQEAASCWIRVAYPSAGSGWGFQSIPRIGQEVVVDFEEGDPDRPLVIGTVHNAEQLPPYVLPGRKTVSGIKTRSSKTGGSSDFNEIRFDDKQGNEYLYLQAQKDWWRLVKNDAYSQINRHRHSLVKGNALETIEGMCDVVVKGDASARTEGARSEVVQDDWHCLTQGQYGLEAASDLSLKAGAQVSAQAGSSVELLAGSTVNVSAGQSIKLSAGACSITIGPAGIVMSGPAVSVSGGQGGSASPKAPGAPAAAGISVIPPDPIQGEHR